MRFVRVQYDAYNRQFHVMDQDLARNLEDGGMYLIADSSPDDFLPVDEMERETAEVQ